MIEIINVSKKFRIWEDRSRDLKETAINFLRGKKRSYRDLWALKAIDLEIREGETVAFIGQNGSGKSTLLKILAGIYAPYEGKVIARGRISTLLELGVGFHQDLTGEENIFLNGAMLGFDRKEMEQRLDEIVSFSEIGDFVYSPIRTYSSGMLMRLGFSIAMCVNPDVLLIDEVLAVGDEAFQEKCFERLDEFKASGKTIVLVSHSMEAVKKFCDRAILLREGRIVCDDIPEKTIDAYHALLYGDKHRPAVEEELEPEEPAQEGIPSGETPYDESATGAGSGETVPFDEEQQVEGGISLTPEMASQEAASEGEKKEPPEKDLFHPEKIRIIEIDDLSFWAGRLFRECYGHDSPSNPRNFVAVYPDSGDLSSSLFAVVGCIHMECVSDEISLVGGLCVDHQWRGKGVDKRLLLSVDEKRRREKAFFVYTDDSRFASDCGYKGLPQPYLMVKWMESLSEEEKAGLVDAAGALGPF